MTRRILTCSSCSFWRWRRPGCGEGTTAAQGPPALWPTEAVSPASSHHREACQWTGAVVRAAPGLSQGFLYPGRAGGFAADPEDRPGLAELLTATLDQGTATRTAKQIAEELQAAGGDLSATAGSESIVVTTGVLCAKAEAGLALLADVARHATFPDEEVELAKRNAVGHLQEQEADPSFLAERALARAAFRRASLRGDFLDPGLDREDHRRASAQRVRAAVPA